MKRYKMTLTILSPVHIGAGRQVDPLEYMVKKKDGYFWFYHLDTARFLENLTPPLRTQFDDAVKQATPVYLRKFITQHIDPEKYQLFQTTISDEFVAAYHSSFASMNNQLQVELFPRNGLDRLPYLPGSSLKGAIRTAVVSSLAKPNNIEGDRDKGIWIEKKLFGYNDPKQDPFKMLRITDAPLPDNATFIDQTKIYKPNTKAGMPDPGGIKMFYEQCFSFLDDEEITAEGILEINDDLIGKKGVDRRGNPVDAVSRSLSDEDILRACREFYLPKMEAEHREFYASHHDAEPYSLALLNKVKYAPNECPIRIGRFCHVECHTLDLYRNPKTRRNRNGRPLPWGTTRTLSAGTMPMGWAKLRLDLIRS